MTAENIQNSGILTKDFGLEVKHVDEAGLFEGYASVFGGEPDSYGDVVETGAFTVSLRKHASEGTMPSLLWGHNHNELPIGRWLELREDGKGLWAKGRLNLSDPVGARVHAALQEKAVRGLSIGYRTISEERDRERKGVNRLIELDLWEISIVNFPANRRSFVEAVKGGGPGDIRRMLQQGTGCSNRLAKQLADEAWTKAAGQEGNETIAAAAELEASIRRLGNL